jgi:hypothetical protein
LNLYQKALLLQQTWLLTNHEDLSDTYSKVGGVYHIYGNMAAAQESYEQNLQLFEKCLPTNHHFSAHHGIGQGVKIHLVNISTI